MQEDPQWHCLLRCMSGAQSSNAAEAEGSVCFCIQDGPVDPSTLAAVAEQCHRKLQEKVTAPAGIKAQQCQFCIHPHARIACSAVVGMPATALPVQWSSR